MHLKFIRLFTSIRRAIYSISEALAQDHVIKMRITVYVYVVDVHVSTPSHVHTSHTNSLVCVSLL